MYTQISTDYPTSMSCSPLRCWQGQLKCLQEVLLCSTVYPKKPESQLMCLMHSVPSLLNPFEKVGLFSGVTHSSSPSPALLSEMTPAQADSWVIEGRAAHLLCQPHHSVLIYARTDTQTWLFPHEYGSFLFKPSSEIPDCWLLRACLLPSQQLVM